MSSLYVYINTTKKHWRPGVIITNTTDKEWKMLLSDFAWFIAQTYQQEVIRAIRTQRYKDKWVPLSPGYLEWKKKNNMSLHIWEATGFLKNSIEVNYDDRYHRFIVGPSPRTRYPGSSMTVLKVSRYMEYGTSKMPARPLFGPIQVYISKNIRRYWDKYLRGKGIE